MKQVPNIQMQKTGAGVVYQGDASLPASDLGRYAAAMLKPYAFHID